MRSYPFNAECISRDQDVNMATLRDLAQQDLDDLRRRGISQRPPTLERIWVISALESIVQGHLVEPDIGTLKHLTAPIRVWDELNPAWPPDHVTTILDSVRRSRIWPSPLRRGVAH